MRLRYGQSFLNRTDSATGEYKSMTIRQVIEQINRYIKTMVRNLISSVKYITEITPMPLMRINYYIYAEDEKAGSELGRGFAFEGIG